MGLFGFGKKGGDFVDLAERYRKQKEKESESSESKSSDLPPTPFSFFDMGSSSKVNEASEDVIDLTSSAGSVDTESAHEKRRKLAKRLAEMTTKLEDLSNQIYHLQQRIDLLEKKTDANKY